MTLKKLVLKPGVNRENTRYYNENGWYVSQWVRFRQGTPEKIGGYERLSDNTFVGICRSLGNWVTLGGVNLLGVGTNAKFYVESGGAYFDITPYRTFFTSGTLSNPFSTTNASVAVSVSSTAHGLRAGDVVFFTGATAVGGVPAAELNTRHTVTSVTNANTYVITVPTAATSTVSSAGGTVAYRYYAYYQTLTNPFSTTSGSTTVVVDATAHGAILGDTVYFSNASAVGGLTINGAYTITQIINVNSYQIVAASAATSTAGPGGGTVYAEYELNSGTEIQSPSSGWGAYTWGAGTWGIGLIANVQLGLWSQSNFGEDLVYAPHVGPLCYWSYQLNGFTGRGVEVATLTGANDVPALVGGVLVSDVSRFVIAFGASEVLTGVYDPMLIRWSDQETVVNWAASATTQAGSARLSHGSEIVSKIQTRQEILVWTDSALYSLQYVGPPAVWAPQLLASSISIIGPNATAMAAGVAYWMGNGKFYSYNGTVTTLKCDLRKFIFQDFNFSQALQVVSGSNEEFNEVWWFYPSTDSLVPDKYVIYNYLEAVWSYGTLTRYAWLDKSTRDYPMASTEDRIVYHDIGVDDNTTPTTLPIESFIESAEFDIDDGDHFGFVRRMLPDLTFTGSTAANPSVIMTLYPMDNSGSGFGTSLGGLDSATVTRSVSVPVEQFTGQVYIRVRGRQMVMRIASTDVGVEWQLGAPRIDIRQDGRRGGSFDG
jgi:hypothetical protein